MDMQPWETIEAITSPWGVFETFCVCCGHTILVIATVHSVEHGYAEAFEQGQPTCMACQAVRKTSRN